MQTLPCSVFIQLFVKQAFCFLVDPIFLLGPEQFKYEKASIVSSTKHSPTIFFSLLEVGMCSCVCYKGFHFMICHRLFMV